MISRIGLLLLLSLPFWGTSCGFLQAPVVPPNAAIYTNYTAPLDVDFQATAMGKKRGEASAISVLGIVSLGDASARKAAENGGIGVIRSADYRYMTILGALFTQYTTIVYGD